MTPDERQLISELFERMRSTGPIDKDRDAESLIMQLVLATPDAAYKLVQSVLVQENALQEAGARMEELQAEVDQLRAQVAPPAPAQKSSGGFLGGLFGGGSRAEPPRQASVPSFGSRQAEAPPRQPSSPWGNAPAQPSGYGQQGGYAPQQGYAQPQQSAGGGFMRQAAMTAAGVAGGMLAAGAIRDMMGGGSAHASTRPQDQSGERSPYEVGLSDEQQRAENERQDAEQDAQWQQDQQDDADAEPQFMDPSDNDPGNSDDQ